MSFFGNHLENYEKLEEHLKKIKTSDLNFNYKVSLFYDNDENNFQSSDKYPIIVPILVNESKYNYNKGEYHDLMQETLGKSKFNDNRDSSKILDFLKTPGKTGREMFDIRSGISIMQLYSLMEFIKKFRDNINVLIFDWDRTLTITEGLLPYYPSLASKKNRFENNFPRNNYSFQFFKSGIKNPDKRYIEAIFGGKERCYLLKKLYDLCNKMKLPIFILTNNGSLKPEKLKQTKTKTDLFRNEIKKFNKGEKCTINKYRNQYLPESIGEPNNNKQFFLEYLKVIGWNINPDNIIYNIKGNKYITAIGYIEDIKKQISVNKIEHKNYTLDLNKHIKDLLLSEKIYPRIKKDTINNSNFRSMENINLRNNDSTLKLNLDTKKKMSNVYKYQLLSIYSLV